MESVWIHAMGSTCTQGISCIISSVQVGQFVFVSAHRPLSHHAWLKSRSHTNITLLLGSGALRLNAEDPFLCVAKSVDQAHHRLGIAAGVSQERQEQIATSDFGTPSSS